jgi:hypothetical protein
MARIMADLRRIGKAARSAIAGDAVEPIHIAGRDDEISRKLDLLMRGQTELVKAINIQLDRIRPSRLAWAQAGFFLIASATLVALSAVWAVNVSTVSSQATTLHEQANAYRTQALENLLPFEEAGALVTPAQLRHDLADPKRLQLLLSQARIGTKLQDQANKMDVEADQREAKATNSQIEAQIGLAVSSAFLGSILGWMITQLLTELRWRRRVRSGPAEAASAPHELMKV